MKSAQSNTFKTPIGTLAFAQGLFKARAVQEGAVPKYGCTAIFSNDVDRTPFNDAVKDVILASWGEKGLQRAKEGMLKLPFLKGDGKEATNKTTGEIQQGLGPDVWFIRMISGADRPPFVRANDPNLQATEQEVYSGCRGFWVCHAFSWNNPQSGDGVSLSVSMFRKTGEGPRLGGGVIDPEKWFGDASNADGQDAAKGAGGLFS